MKLAVLAPSLLFRHWFRGLALRRDEKKEVPLDAPFESLAVA